MPSTFSRRIRFESLEPRHMLTFLAGDYNLSGAVDNDDYNVWRANYGNIGESPIDGNNNEVIDTADYVVWRNNLGKTLADVAPNGPTNVEARAVGATSIEVKWEAAAHATSYLVQRRAPATETDFTTIATVNPDVTHTDNTATADTLYEYRIVAQNANGDSPPSQAAQAVANQSNLTAYRPQGVFGDEENEPKYDDPFPRTPVPEEDENTAAEGPGIRINADDDNQNGVADRAEMGTAIAEENDLIEVKIDRLPGQGNLVLSAGFDLLMYTGYSKSTPFESNTTIPFVNNSFTIWVEWVDSIHGTDTITLIDQGTMAPLDTIRFHSFRSMVVVFGGRTQSPFDSDGDGSIGDPVNGGPNREGMFDVAQNLYVTGWDVYAHAENEDLDFVFNEITNAVDRRFVTPDFSGGPTGGISIMGYSQGGGATYTLIEQIFQDRIDITPIYGVYLDAVQSFGPFAQTNWPRGTFYMLNIYETIDIKWHGGDINDEEVFPGALLEEHDVTTELDPNIDHEAIDDNVQVKATIRARLEFLMLR